MHNELERAAVLRATVWLAVTAMLAASGFAVSVGKLSMIAGLIVFVLLTPVMWWLLVRRSYGPIARSRPREVVVDATGRISNLGEALAVATGSVAPRIGEVNSTAPNVAAIPEPSGNVLLVTTGAEALLNRAELETVCAMQLALLHDPAVARLKRATANIGTLRVWSLVLILPLFVGIIFPVAGLAAAAWISSSRLRWWTSVASDAVAIETTRNPEALANALEKLATYNGSQVTPRGFIARFGGADAFWAVPVNAGWTSTTSMNGRTTRRSSSQLDSDVRLLTRANAVRNMCLGAAEHNLSEWKRISKTLAEVTAQVAQTGAGEAFGVRIGLEGVEGGATTATDPKLPVLPSLLPDTSGWTYPDALQALISARPSMNKAGDTDTQLRSYGQLLEVVLEKSPPEDREYWQDISRVNTAAINNESPGDAFFRSVWNTKKVAKRLKKNYGIDIM